MGGCCCCSSKGTELNPAPAYYYVSIIFSWLFSCLQIQIKMLSLSHMHNSSQLFIVTLLYENIYLFFLLPDIFLVSGRYKNSPQTTMQYAMFTPNLQFWQCPPNVYQEHFLIMLSFKFGFMFFLLFFSFYLSYPYISGKINPLLELN